MNGNNMFVRPSREGERERECEKNSDLQFGKNNEESHRQELNGNQRTEEKKANADKNHIE